MPYGSPDFAFQVTSPDPRLCPISPNYEPNSTARGQFRASPDYEPAPRAPEHRSNSRESSMLFTPPVPTPGAGQNQSTQRYLSASFSPRMPMPAGEEGSGHRSDSLLSRAWFSPLEPTPAGEEGSGHRSDSRLLSVSFSPRMPTPAGEEAQHRVSQQPTTQAPLLNIPAPNPADHDGRSSSPHSNTRPANRANPITVAQTQTDNGRALPRLLATETFLAEDALHQWIRDNRGIRFFYSTERGPWPLPLGYFSSGGVKHYCSIQQLSERFPGWLTELRGSLADRVVG